MFKTTAPAAEVDHDVIVTSEPLIPLSHLSLDLSEPPIGWVAYLNNIGVEVVEDSIGRSAIAHNDARRLFDEHREAEAVKAELRARQEREAIESDQRFRAQLSGGVAVPAGLSYAEAVVAAELDAQSYRPRRTSVVENLLSNDGITFHPIQDEADES
jgi:hypothetical protein